MAKSTDYVEIKNSKSPVWPYFLKALVGNTAKCKFSSCGEILKVTGGSTHGLWTHLEKKHKIKPPKPSSNNEPNENLATASESNVLSKKRKIDEFFVTKQVETLQEVFSKLAAKDGLTFNVLAKSEELKKCFKARGFINIPDHPATVKNMIIDYSCGVRKGFTEELSILKGKMKKFSLCFDEYTSIKNRRYLNIILFGNDKLWNLGLTRIKGSLPAEQCVDVVNERLNVFGLNLHSDIVSITTDGAAMMKKVGKLISCSQILCMAHGIQLGVVDVLYKKSTSFDDDLEISEMSDDDDENESMRIDREQRIIFELSDENKICATVKKVRQLVAMFRRSPTKNDLLQKYAKEEFNKELQLNLDSKTRWNSMLGMLERFYLLRNCIKKTLIDIKCGNELHDSDLAVISSVISALTPVNDAVKALCKKDANLLTSDVTLSCMLRILQNGDNLSQKLKEKLTERILERRTIISGTLSYLHFGKKLPKGSIFTNASPQSLTKFILDILERLTPEEEDVESSSESEPDNEMSADAMIKMNQKIQEEINMHFTKNKSDIVNVNNTKNRKKALKREIAIFDDSGIKGPLLSLTYELLLTVKPTSVESERAFSSTTFFCNKLRTRLNDDSLDHLCFLKAFFPK